MTKIRLNLLDNGLDYIYEAVRPIFFVHDESRHSWKYSVLHLYSGIELLLKEKLRQEHWSLIFQDISSANPKKLEIGDFISVYHDELIKRLRRITKVNINDEPIKRLRDLRNRFEHFEVKITLDECQEIVAAALDEIIKFWENNLNIISTVEQQEKFAMIKSIAISFETYRKQRLEKFNIAIEEIVKNKSGLIIPCPTCCSLSFAVFKDDEKECKCFVCDKKYRKNDYLKIMREHEEDCASEESFVYGLYKPYDTICIYCKKETKIRYYDSNFAPSYYFCLSCLNKEEIKEEQEPDPEFEEWVEKLLDIPIGEDFLKFLEERFTREESIELMNKFKEHELNRLEKELERRKSLGN